MDLMPMLLTTFLWGNSNIVSGQNLLHPYKYSWRGFCPPVQIGVKGNLSIILWTWGKEKHKFIDFFNA